MRVLERGAQRVGSGELVQLLLDRGAVDLSKLVDDRLAAEGFLVHLVVAACQQGNVGFVQALAKHSV